MSDVAAALRRVASPGTPGDGSVEVAEIVARLTGLAAKLDAGNAVVSADRVRRARDLVESAWHRPEARNALAQGSLFSEVTA